MGDRNDVIRAHVQLVNFCCDVMHVRCNKILCWKQIDERRQFMFRQWHVCFHSSEHIQKASLMNLDEGSPKLRVRVAEQRDVDQE